MKTIRFDVKLDPRHKNYCILLDDMRITSLKWHEVEDNAETLYLSFIISEKRLYNLIKRRIENENK